MNVLVRSGPIQNRNQKFWVPFLLRLRRINQGTCGLDATVLVCKGETFDQLRQNPYSSAFTARLEFFSLKGWPVETQPLKTELRLVR